MQHPNRIAYYRDRCEPPLTQGELAALLAVHSNTVQNWERQGVARSEALLRLVETFINRGALTSYHDALAFWQSAARDRCPPPPELRALFARSGPAGTSATLQLPLGAVPPPARRSDRLPYAFNERFVGREADLRVLAALLRSPGAVAAICGIGGLGKTQLAVMFAYYYGAMFSGGVHWINAADPGALAAQVAASGDERLHPHFARLGFARRLELVQRTWRDPVPRLLIFDNCEDPAALFEWRPPVGGCRILVTSRTREWAAYEVAQVVDLQPIAREASVTLLRSYGASRESDDLLARIAAALGDLPLALHLAGRHLANTDENPATYAAHLEHPRHLRHRSFQYAGPSPTDYSFPLAEIFARSYARLGDSLLETTARAILELIRFLAPAAPIPLDFLFDALGYPLEQQAALAAVHHLSEHLSLLDLQPDQQAVRIHPLVHTFLNESPPCERRYSDLVRAIHARCVAAGEHGRTLSEPLALQLRHVADQARANRLPEASTLCKALAWPLAGASQFEAAQHYGECAVELCKQRFGAEHPNTAEALNDLGLILQNTQSYEICEGYYRRALAIWERACGPESLEAAMACNNLGFLAIINNKHAESDAYLRRALRLRRRMLGLRHTSTARCIHNLGYLALRSGAPRMAVRYLRLALELRRQLLSEPNYSTAFTLALLAESHLAQGDLPAAQRYAEEAHSMRYGTAGTESDESGASMALFGKIARIAGNLEYASTLYEQAVRMRRSMLGPNAPETLSDSAHLAGIYFDLGRIEEARQLLTSTLTSLRATVGEESYYFKTAWVEWVRLEGTADYKNLL